MRCNLLFVLFICVCVVGFTGVVPVSLASEEGGPVKGRSFYVRQTVGDDANNGMSPETAWSRISRLSREMRAGDTAYIGPGLYREGIWVHNSGTADNRLTFIADSTGQYTGDPPGVVMITGAEPVDEGIFKPYSTPGVYMAKVPDFKVWGVVEMDGDQYRYTKATSTKEYLVDNVPAIDVVAKFPSSYFYDEEAKTLFIHTSDKRKPGDHEIELIRRLNGISMVGKHYVTVIGFAFRHMGDAGINFFKGSGDGIAINNTSYGSRQGIRVYNATDIAVYGTTLFRNENCGVYFAAESTNGLVVGNTAYENIKGVRWSSQSVGGIAIDNTLFDNHEAGVSIENADNTTLMRNRIVNNRKYQLLVTQSDYHLKDNCFQSDSSEQLNIEILYEKGKHRDEYSRQGDCGQIPEKLDVIRLHAETMGYAERARRILKGLQKTGNVIP